MTDRIADSGSKRVFAFRVLCTLSDALHAECASLGHLQGYMTDALVQEAIRQQSLKDVAVPTVLLIGELQIAHVGPCVYLLPDEKDRDAVSKIGVWVNGVPPRMFVVDGAKFALVSESVVLTLPDESILSE